MFTIDPSNVEVSPAQTYLSYNHDLIGVHTFKLTATHAGRLTNNTDGSLKAYSGVLPIEPGLNLVIETFTVTITSTCENTGIYEPEVAIERKRQFFVGHTDNLLRSFD